MAGGRRDGWTLLLLRSGGAGAPAWRLEGRRALWGAGAAALLLLAAGVGAGLWWAGQRQSRRVQELEARVERLDGERGRMLALTSRLDSVEAAYRRLRRVMSGEVAASERDVRLPPVPADQAATPAEADGGAAPPSFVWPLAQRGFVTRRHQGPAPGGPEEHPGLDIAVPTGSYVRATRGGVVEAAGEDAVYGLYVRLRHGDEFSSLYGHNRWLFVAAGDTVERAEVIALSGSSGRSTAPHLHFELTRDGQNVDPAAFLDRGTGRELPQGRGGR